MEGDGWTRCGLGHRHWGRYGAAGLLLAHRDTAGRCWVLLQQRAAWTHHGGTWSLPGGAAHRTETPAQTAWRECAEEVAVDLSGVRPRGVYLDEHGGGWAYATVLADAPGRLVARTRGQEGAAVRWVRAERVPSLTLHPGFAASWPRLPL